jgi:hypothetical protein
LKIYLKVFFWWIIVATKVVIIPLKRYKGRCREIDNHPFVMFKIRLVYSIVGIRLVLGGYQNFLIPIGSNFHNKITKGFNFLSLIKKINLCTGQSIQIFTKHLTSFHNADFHKFENSQSPFGGFHQSIIIFWKIKNKK